MFALSKTSAPPFAGFCLPRALPPWKSYLAQRSSPITLSSGSWEESAPLETAPPFDLRQAMPPVGAAFLIIPISPSQVVDYLKITEVMEPTVERSI